MARDRPLHGEVAIVTGASRGLGAAIAARLAGAGAAVLLVSRSLPDLRRVEEGIRAAGGRAASLDLDLADIAGLPAVVPRAVEEFGGLTILVNNAGVQDIAAFETLDAARIRNVVDVNLTASLELTRLAVGAMLERRRGHVVTIASLAGRVGTPFNAVYSATKAAQIAASHALRAEYRGRGVDFSVICPGFVKDRGMWRDEGGFGPPRLLGSTTSDAVATAVLTALRRKSPEIYVNSPASRPLLGIAELSPRLRELVLRRIGLTRTWQRAALAREQRARSVDHRD